MNEATDQKSRKSNQDEHCSDTIKKFKEREENWVSINGDGIEVMLYIYIMQLHARDLYTEELKWE